MRVTVWEVEGTPDEINKMDIKGMLKQHHASVPEQQESQHLVPVLPPEVLSLLDSVPPDRAETVKGFVGKILAWGNVDAHRGNRRNGEGMTSYVRLHRRGSNLGAFAYFRPRRLKVTFRLPRDAAENYQFAEARDVKRENRYQVRIYLKSPEAVEEALTLAKAAYDEVVG